METQEQPSASTSTPAATAGGDILDRLSKEVRKHDQVRTAMAPHSESVGHHERLLIDAKAEIERLRAMPRPEEVAPQRYNIYASEAYGEPFLETDANLGGEWVKWDDIASHYGPSARQDG